MTKLTRRGVPLVLVLGLIAGCASAQVGSVRDHAADEQLPRPARIIVYDFAVDRTEVRIDNSILKEATRRSDPRTPEELNVAHEVAAALGAELVTEILSYGMPAERAAGTPPPGANDLEIEGQFVSIDEGSRSKRMLIGFGAGASELHTLVQVFRMRENDRQLVQEADVVAAGGKMPGVAIPVGAGAAAGRVATSAAVSGGTNVLSESGAGGESVQAGAKRTAREIAKVLSRFFARQGWIPTYRAADP